MAEGTPMSAADTTASSSPITVRLDPDQVDALAKAIADEKSASRSPWLTTRQVADYLSLSVDAVHRLTAAKAIPHSKVAGRCLFNRADVDRWLRDKSAGQATVSTPLPRSLEAP
jgi:excisionase family DNA binding protein